MLMMFTLWWNAQTRVFVIERLVNVPALTTTKVLPVKELHALTVAVMPVFATPKINLPVRLVVYTTLLGMLTRKLAACVILDEEVQTVL